MNRQQAIKILGLNNNYSEEELKKQYRLMALKYHPDKNKSDTANEDFQNIQAAYSFLSELSNVEKEECSSESYDEMLKCFVNLIIKTKFSLKLLIQLDIEVLELIVKLMNTYLENSSWNNYFKHIERLKTEIENIIKERKQDIDIIVLEPSLKDLFEQKIFCLKRNDNVFLVPLWHSEMTFNDVSGNFIVKCCPVLPEHIDIDEYNNIVVHLKRDITSLLDNEKINFNIEEKEYEINTRLLLIKREQQVMIPHKGIPRINEKDFDKNIEIGDIVIFLTLK